MGYSISNLVVSFLVLSTGGGSMLEIAHAYNLRSAPSADTSRISATINNNRNQQLLVAREQTSFASSLSRRNLLATAAATVSTVWLWGGGAESSRAALAASDDDVLTPCYFGVGCFWHIQHEFIEQGERAILGRKDHQLTSVAGYAGGTSTDKDGRVCYHNLQGIADYGKLGHGEVVGMSIPQSKIPDFATLYFSLYNPKTKDRVDPQDRGAEYRSLLGLPGGMNHPMYQGVEAAATNAGFQLVQGKGNDPDTLGKQIVYVYDTKKFPFYPGEVYHQYHNDFQSAPYGKTYNSLANVALEDGRIKGTGCPDRV